MSLLSKLFGGGAKSAPKAEPVLYEGFQIFPEPMKEAGGHRVAARIEKEIDGTIKSHQMIRADLIASPDEATEVAIAKARKLIDEQGEHLFG
jgi:hypothetical protein